MGLFNLWSSKKTPPAYYEKDKAGNHIYKLTDHDLGSFRSCFTGGYSEQNMITVFENIPEVFAPIDAIASRVANGVFQLKRIKDDEIVYDNRSWNRLMEKQPNWRQTVSKFIYNLAVYKYTAGNRYIYTQVPSTLKKKLDNISAMWLLPPQNTEPKIKQNRTKLFTSTSKSDIVDYYKVSIWSDSEEIKPEFVVHDAFLQFGVNQYNILKGVGPLKSAELPMSNLIQVYQARNVIYVKRGALGFIVGENKDSDGIVALTPKDKDQIRETLQDTYGITGGKSPWGITDVPISFERIAMSIEELQPFDETYASAAAVYGVLRVPRTFIPSKEGVTYANGASDERKLYQDVAIPDAKEICLLLNEALGLEAEGYYADVSFDHVEVLQDDKKARAELDKIKADTSMMLYEKNFITKNQMLVSVGLSAIPGGDIFINDGKNPDPLAVKIGVGGVQALQSILLSTIGPEEKIKILAILFNIPEPDAKNMVGTGDSSSSNSSL